MKKLFYSCAFCSVVFLHAQQQNHIKKDSTATFSHLQQKGMFLGFSVVNQSFQDSRYTDLIYQNVNYGFQVGYKNQNEKRIWEIGFGGFYGTIHTTVGKPYNTVAVKIYFDYLHNIFHRGKTHFYLGGRLDLIDMYFRTLESEEGKRSELINNPGGYIFGIGQVALQGLLVYDFNQKWQWQSVARLQLFGVMKQTPSFATSTPQYYLSQKSFETPDGNFIGGQWQAFYRYLNLSFSQKIFYKQRYSLAYEWVFKRSREVVGYPVTRGVHFLTLGVQF